MAPPRIATKTFPGDENSHVVKDLRERAVRRVSGEMIQQSPDEQERNQRLREITEWLLPRYGNRWNVHNLVTMTRQSLSRALYYNELYQKVVNVPGVICEFGVQWGATLAQLINLRGIYEPFNHSRVIYGFDTFEGFVDISEEDAGHAKIGDYATLPRYEEMLERILALHESFAPTAHIKKFELVKGDASVTIDHWLAANPHTIVAMAIFDMDVYQPTRVVLEKILPRLTKGSVLVFDELSCPQFPGETRALHDVLGINNIALRHFPHQAYCAWAIYGE